MDVDSLDDLFGPENVGSSGNSGSEKKVKASANVEPADFEMPELKIDDIIDDLESDIEDPLDQVVLESSDEALVFEKKDISESEKKAMRESFVKGLKGSSQKEHSGSGSSSRPKRKKKPRYSNRNQDKNKVSDSKNPYAKMPEKSNKDKKKAPATSNNRGELSNPYKQGKNGGGVKQGKTCGDKSVKKGQFQADLPKHDSPKHKIKETLSGKNESPLEDMFAGPDVPVESFDNDDLDIGSMTDDDVESELSTTHSSLDSIEDVNKEVGEQESESSAVSQLSAGLDKANPLDTLKYTVTDVFNKLKGGSDTASDSPSLLDNIKNIFTKKGKDSEDISEYENAEPELDDAEKGSKNVGPVVVVISVLVVVVVAAVIPWGSIVNQSSIKEDVSSEEMFIEDTSNKTIAVNDREGSLKDVAENNGVGIVIPGANDPVKTPQVSEHAKVDTEKVDTGESSIDSFGSLDDGSLGSPTSVGGGTTVSDVQIFEDPEAQLLAQQKKKKKLDEQANIDSQDISLQSLKSDKDSKQAKEGLSPPPVVALEASVTEKNSQEGELLRKQLEQANQKLASVESKLDALINQQHARDLKREQQARIRYWLPPLTVSAVVMRGGHYYARVVYDDGKPIYVREGEKIRKWTVEQIDSDGLSVVFGGYIKTYSLHNSIEDDIQNSEGQRLPMVERHRNNVVHMGTSLVD